MIFPRSFKFRSALNTKIRACLSVVLLFVAGLTLYTNCGTAFQVAANSSSLKQTAGSLPQPTPGRSSSVFQPFPTINWRPSVPVPYQDPSIQALGGTESRSLVFSNKKLYAAIGDWTDTELDNAQNPGAQILRLDSSGGTWVVEHVFGEPLPGTPEKKKYFAVASLNAFHIVRDQTGQPIVPVDILIAGVWNRAAGLEFFEKIGEAGVWTKVILADTTAAPIGSQLRASTSYTDSVTGVQRILLGTNPLGIYSGAYDSQTKTMVWDSNIEPGSFNVLTTAPAKGSSRDRVTSFTVCGAKLYAAIFDAVVVRTDGAQPTWRKVYEFSDQFPDVAISTQSSGLRGLTCVPSGPNSSGEVLISAMENNPLQIIRINIDSTPATAVVEFDMSAYLTPVFQVQAGYGVGAYNDMPIYPSGDPACPDRLIGLSIFAPKYPTAFRTMFPLASYFVRHCDATYEFHNVNDTTQSPMAPLEATRTMVVSQFAGDPAGTLYAGGYDGGGQAPSVRNTAWIYRGVPTSP